MKFTFFASFCPTIITNFLVCFCLSIPLLSLFFDDLSCICGHFGTARTFVYVYSGKWGEKMLKVLEPILSEGFEDDSSTIVMSTVS